MPWSFPLPLASLGSSVSSGLLWLLFCLALFAAPLIAIRAYRDTVPRVGGRTRATLVTLRVLAFWTLLALLAEPVLFRSRTVGVEPSVLFLVDDSASMSVASPGGQTRFERALQLRSQAAEALREIHGDTPVWFGEGSRRLEHSSPTASTGIVTPQGEGTDLRGLLVSATQRHLEDELSAVLLLSDGMVTTEAARLSLGGLRVPVWSVAVGDSAGPTDLGLTRVRYPSRVSRGDRLVIEGEVLVRAPDAGQSLLRLRGAAGAVDSVAVQWPAGTSRHAFEFVVETDSVGYARFQLGIVGVADEKVLRNNEQQVGVRVEKDRLRVLHLQSRPGWDTHFLRHAAASDLRIQWDTVYTTPAGLRVAGTDSTLSWPLRAEELAGIDLFVAGGPADLALIADPASGVLDAVRQGAGLWIQVGEITEQPLWSDAIRSIAPLVPERRARWVFAESRVDLPVEARSHPVWALPPELGDPGAILNRIPPLQARVAPLGLSVDADLLLRSTSANTEAPVLAVRREGQGRVAVLNGSPIWSWSFWRLGDEGSQEFFDAFVTNLVTWMAEGGDRQRLRLQVPRPVVARGEVITLRGLALDASLRPETRRDVWLEWAPAEEGAEAAGRVRMTPDPATPGSRVVELPALPAGEYRLRCTLEENSGSLSSPWQRLTVDPFSVEFQDPRVDRLQLASLARATGGELVTPDGFEEWARGLDLSRREVLLTGRIDLGARLWLLLPLLFLLSAEWALRKRAGLI